MNELIWVAIIVATLAFLLSVINAIRISGLRKRVDVDLVNHREDVNLSMESVKFTATREVKNLRKEINKRNKPNPPRRKPVAKDGEADSKGAQNETSEKPAQGQRKPNPNRQKNYRPRKKPILKNPEGAPPVASAEE